MSNRLTDDQLGWFDRYIRPGYDEMASGDDMLALVAEVREHRATIERVRAICGEGMCSPGDRAADLAMAGQHWALVNVLKALDADQ